MLDEMAGRKMAGRRTQDVRRRTAGTAGWQDAGRQDAGPTDGSLWTEVPGRKSSDESVDGSPRTEVFGRKSVDGSPRTEVRGTEVPGRESTPQRQRSPRRSSPVSFVAMAMATWSCNSASSRSYSTASS
jgi:hypothetical protein